MPKSKKRAGAAARDPSIILREESTNQQGGGNRESARDRIALRAYELYLARGGIDGGDFDDWLAAERELIGSNAQSGSDRRE